jgi:CRP-like cAMP-binding protein
MAKNVLLQAVDPIRPLNEPDASLFVSLFEERSYKRNTTLLAAGEVAHELFFVREGGLRQFFSNEDGVERTCNFYFENEFATDLESFSQQCKASTTLLAFENTTCLVTTCVAIANAMRESKEIADFFRSLVEKVAQDEIRRTKSMLAYPPERQFEELLERRPEWIQRIPQRYIAQYLGIAPESLSRIRKRSMEQTKS